MSSIEKDVLWYITPWKHCGQGHEGMDSGSKSCEKGVSDFVSPKILHKASASDNQGSQL